MRPNQGLAKILSRSGSSALVALSGEIDVGNAEQLNDCLQGCVDDGCTELTLDLSELRFIDSTGLASLFALVPQLTSRDGRMVLKSPTRPVQKVIDITGLNIMADVIGPT